jgi:glycosyltransferase involved in cell wall biosynthesis
MYKLPAQSAKFGIFIPVLNGEDYIAEAIDSVMAQVCGDWMLVVLDNASTDRTPQILSRYSDKRICVRRFEVRVDIISSWKRISETLGTDLLRFDFMTILGHDDLFLPNFLSSIEELVEKYPEAGLYLTHFWLIDSIGKMIRPCKPIPETESYSDFLLARMWGLRDSFGTGYVFRPYHFLSIGGMPELPSLLYADDLLFSRLSQKSMKATSSAFSSKYRVHSGSTSTGLTATRIEHQLLAIWTYIQHLRSDFPNFMESEAAKYALGCLLAREVLPFDALGIKRLLSKEASEVLSNLCVLYSSTLRGIPTANWVGTNFVTRSLYLKIKRWGVFYLLLKARLATFFQNIQVK